MSENNEKPLESSKSESKKSPKTGVLSEKIKSVKGEGGEMIMRHPDGSIEKRMI